MTPSRRDLLTVAGAAAVVGLPATARSEPRMLPHADPASLGLDPKQLQVAYDLLAGWTQGKDAPIPSAALLVGRRGKVVAPRFFGRMGPAADAPPIRPDALFLLASITKPVVYTAAMLLVERGKLNLTDRVVKYVPEFKANEKDSVLVRHLFTHTSGLPDMLPENDALRRKHAPLQRFLDGASTDTEPLFPPGTKVSYQSMGTAVVAEIVQRLSGVPIAEFLKRELFDPLGLKSTALGAAGLPRERLVAAQLPEFQTDPGSDWNSDYWRNLGAPWGGMFSTPEDFAVICQLLLSKGTHAGVRLLSPATVRAMTTNRLLDLPELPEAVARSQPWGLGWRLNHPGMPDSWGDLLGPRTFGHTGATGTMVWIDPDADAFLVLLANAVRAKAPARLVSVSNAVAAAFV